MKSVLVSIILSLTFLSFAQTVDTTKQIKIQIAELYKKKDIKTINRLLNTNTFLDSEYSLYIIKQNLEYALAQNEKNLIADTYLTLGNFWFTQGNHTKAFDYYLKAETTAKETKDYRIIGLSTMNRSIITEDLTEKNKLLEVAISEFEEAKDYLNLAKAHLNLGNNFSNYIIRSQDSTSFSNQTILQYKTIAFEHYTLAQKLNRTLQNDEIEGSIQVHFAEWLAFEKKYDEARLTFRKAEESFVSSGRIKGKVYCLQQLARIDQKNNQPDQAINLLKEAEKLAVEFNYIDNQVEIYKLLVQLYKSKGEMQKAISYYDLYHLSALNLSETNSRDKIHNLNLEYSLVQNAHLLEKTKHQNFIYRIITITSLMLILFFSGLFYLIIQNKKRKIQTIEQAKIISDIKIKNQSLQEELLKEKLKFNQEHLIIFATQVSKIEHFLEELKTQIKKSQSSPQKINALKRSFSEIMEDHNYIKKLNSLSSELNQDFFLYLRKEHPKLTKNDEQLLSFLILDMSSKKIGEILKISTESVHTKRYRLRKKLGLHNNESFIDFYKKTIRLIEK